ncbi:hypothetical protein H0H87_002638 [Tephrocybe sp. NHM501043]|nr:hypothetical protein H0H87_002638 [Tephrocybe sp. NHM501043]
MCTTSSSRSSRKRVSSHPVARSPIASWADLSAIEQHRIHTVIPVHQVTHEAPVVHKSQTHAPVSMEYFAQKGGQIVGGLKYDEVGSTVLRNGQCTRDVDGEGENIAQNLTGTHILENADHFAQRSGKHEPGTDSGHLGERDESGRQSFGTGVTDKGKFGAGSTGERNDGIFADGGQSYPKDAYGGRSTSGATDRIFDHQASSKMGYWE